MKLIFKYYKLSFTCLYPIYNHYKNNYAFSLVEIMIAIFIMASALIPVAALMTNTTKETNINESFVAMMHQSTRILNTLLERVKYSDIIAAAMQNGLPNANAVNEVTIVNLLDIKDSTNGNQPVFNNELNFGGAVAGKTWQYAEPSRQFEPIIFTLKIKQMNKTFRYLKNVGLTNAVTNLNDIPSFDTTDPQQIGSVDVSGKLMKLTLIANWGKPRPGNNKPFQYEYSLITFKAKLED